MTNNMFNISATKQDGKALIRITGTIGLDIAADPFREQVDDLISQGVADAHIYINSPGGSCFDASEIVNIIKASFKGNITGEGGALVASAATYIALHCNSFTMPQNGMFMIHKPSGVIKGDAKALKSYTKLLNNIESQYLNTYKQRAANKNLLQENWDAGDWWMTAEEAKQNGFITGVTSGTTLDSTTVHLISACGCPQNKVPQSGEEPLRQISSFLGLAVDSSVEKIIDAIAIIKGEETPEKAIEKAMKIGAVTEFEKEEFQVIAQTNPETFTRLIQKRIIQNKDAQVKRISEIVETAVLEKRFVATAAPYWKELFSIDFDLANSALQQMEPVRKVQITRPGASSESRSGWTLDEYRKNDPLALRRSPELYNQLLEKEIIKNQ